MNNMYFLTVYAEDLLEELIAFETLTLQDQIEDFEHWEAIISSSNNNGMNDDKEQVICPICTRSYLRLTGGNTVCCQDESCSFRLTVNNLTTDRPLSMLREQLRQAFEEHSEGCCEPLAFQSTTVGGVSIVVGNCMGCGRSFNIL